MIRSATISDCDPIADTLWQNWQHFKTLQVASPLHSYTSSQVLKDEIRDNLDRWLVCESCNPKEFGFFALSNIGTDKRYKKWCFPERAIKIEHFACLLSGEILFRQFQLLAFHLCETSMLLCFSSSLRNAYWAALKAGFRLLGESPLIVGTFAWMYLDREDGFGAIQTKLRRAKIVIVEQVGGPNRYR